MNRAVIAPVDKRKSSGQAAESLACARLEAAGLVCLARNVRYPFGELDLVMRDGDVVAFVEVRLRRSQAYGGAAVSVNAGKRRKLVRAAQAWLGSHRQYGKSPCRFDVVAFAAPDDTACDWIKNAFTLDDVRA